MVLSIPETYESPFLAAHIPELLDRFFISYTKDLTCIEYFLYSKKKMEQVSRSLIVSHEVFSGSLYVSKFYPEIYRQLNCKYMSAACFYMMVHHAAGIFNNLDCCCVNLETDMDVFENFYSRLNDFGFRVFHPRVAQKVSLRGYYHKISMGTEMISWQTV